MTVLPYIILDDGLKLHVLVSPKAHCDKVLGLEVLPDERKGEIGVLRVKVRALPDKGLANKAVLKLLAKTLNVSKSSLELVAGSKARYKTFLINGNGDELAELIDQLILNS